jgi:predicted membrane channel-forming protein YqfA (hemolysin III family)
MNAAPPNATDAQHLRLLSIFHYVLGGLTALLACFPLIHVGLGLAMLFSPEFFHAKPGEQAPPQAIGWFFTCIGGFMFLVGQAMAVCTVLAGRFIARRKRYWFIFVMAGIECAFFPFGTVLGVFTIITLSRETVKGLFGVTPSSAEMA